MDDSFTRDLLAIGKDAELELSAINERPGLRKTSAVEDVIVRTLVRLIQLGDTHGCRDELLETWQSGLLKVIDDKWLEATGEPCMVFRDVDVFEATMQAVRAGLSPETVRSMKMDALSFRDFGLIGQGLVERRRVADVKRPEENNDTRNRKRWDANAELMMKAWFKECRRMRSKVIRSAFIRRELVENAQRYPNHFSAATIDKQFQHNPREWKSKLKAILAKYR